MHIPKLNNTTIAISILLPIFLFFFLFKFSGNITGFYKFHGSGPVSPYLDRDEILFFEDHGYDGIFFLTIALDPDMHHAGTIEVMDLPQYRYRRILFPATGWMLSFGNKKLIPYSLVFINLLAIIGLIYVCGLYFKAQNRNPKKSLLILVAPGIWLILGLSTAGLMASFFLVLSLYFEKKKNMIGVAIALALACLTRETLFMLWFAFLITYLFRKQWKNLFYVSIAALPPALWNLYVYFQFPKTGFQGVNNFDLPLKGILSAVQDLLSELWSLNSISNIYAFVLLLSAAAIIAYRATKNWKKNQTLFIIGGIYSLLFFLSSTSILHHYVHFTRVFSDLFIIAILVCRNTFWEKVFLVACSIEALLLIIFLSN